MAKNRKQSEEKAERGPTPVNNVESSRCISPACRSTERTGYVATNTANIKGVRDGQPFNRITWKRCRCKVCGQARIDKFYELVSGDGQPAVAESEPEPLF